MNGAVSEQYHLFPKNAGEKTIRKKNIAGGKTEEKKPAL
jgi:hypothetical protein